MPSFTADERRVLARAVAEDEGTLTCPACGGEVNRQAVPQPKEVSYVRHRVWLLCTSCKRSGAVDLPNS